MKKLSTIEVFGNIPQNKADRQFCGSFRKHTVKNCTWIDYEVRFENSRGSKEFGGIVRCDSKEDRDIFCKYLKSIGRKQTESTDFGFEDINN